MTTYACRSETRATLYVQKFDAIHGSFFADSALLLRYCPNPLHGPNIRYYQSSVLFILGNYHDFVDDRSCSSICFQNHSTPLLLIRDAYESTVLTSFFYLLLMYISPNPDEQRAVFAKVGLSRQADQAAKRKGEDLKKWVFPLGFIKWKPRVSSIRLERRRLTQIFVAGRATLPSTDEVGCFAVLRS